MWVQTSTASVLGFGFPPTQQLHATVTAPNQVSLFGLRLIWQAVSGDGTGLEASNPSLSLVR